MLLVRIQDNCGILKKNRHIVKNVAIHNFYKKKYTHEFCVSLHLVIIVVHSCAEKFL